MTSCWFCKQTNETGITSIPVELRQVVSQTYAGLPHMGVEKTAYHEKTVEVPCCNRCKRAYRILPMYSFLGGMTMLGVGITVGVLLAKTVPMDPDWLRITLATIAGIIAAALCYLILDSVTHLDPLMRSVTIAQYPELKKALESDWVRRLY